MSHIKFRQSAVDQATSSDQFNETIRIITPHDWLLLMGFGVLLAAIMLWGFLGNIPTRVRGEGILLAESGGIYDAVALSGDSRVVNLNVKLGDTVKKNDVIAYLASPDLSKQIAVQTKYVDELQNKYKILTETAQKEIQNREVETARTQTILEQNLKSESEHLVQVQDFLNGKQALLKKGIITREEVMQTLGDVYNIKQVIADSNNKLIQNKVALNNFKQDWQEKMRDLNLKIDDANRDLAKLKEQLNVEKTVLSPVSGIITSIHSALGDRAQEGKPIASIADKGKGLDAIVYAPAQQGQLIKVGAEVLISPTTFAKEEYGSLEGKVISVSAFPSTPESIMAVLHNEDLVRKFSKEGPPIAFRVNIQKDSRTFSGYKWTSRKGPDQSISPGMMVNAEVTTREQAPISLIIPVLRRWLQF